MNMEVLAMKKCWLAFLLAPVLLLCTAAAMAENAGDFEYTVENGKATITAYNGSETALIVPAALGGSPVTAIGENAFMGCYELTSVSLPQGLTEIGTAAFAGCYGLTVFTVPEGVTDIGETAFMNCDGLTSVSLPGSLLRLGAGAFSDCRALEAIHIPENVTALTDNPFPGCAALTQITVAEGNAALEMRGGLLYNRAGNELACWPQGLAVGKCAVPAGTEAIGVNAFTSCDGITSVDLPDSVTAIRSGAFRFCNGLESISLPAGITVLEDSAFEGCTALKTVTLPQGLTAIAPMLLRGCESLTSVVVPENVTGIGYNAFDSCYALKRVYLPAGLTQISVFAFYGCDSLTDVCFFGTQAQWDAMVIEDLNDPLTEAALHPSWHVETDVDLPEDLLRIESQAFADLEGGSAVRVPSNVEEIADDAFPSADGENPVMFIVTRGSYAEEWAISHGYTVWYDQP